MTVVTVITMLNALSTTRRGRRPATRSPSNSGTGSREETATSRALRRGGRAEPASALTVLVRAARMAGKNVATTATATATPTTSAAVATVIGGVPAAPIRPAPGVMSSGATSQPVI